MEKNFYHEKYVLADYLFSSNLTKAQIAKEMDISLKELNEKIKCYELSWVSTGKRKMSRGQAAIVQILEKILPNERIEFELHLGERLYLDIYIPTYNIGIEYHGRQHYEWVPYFHETEADFILAQRRDVRKEELCREKGISLIAFRYNDNLSENVVFSRLLEAIKNCPKPVDIEKDEEFERRHKEQLAKASQRRSAIRKDIKAKRELDHEFQQQQKEFRKLQRAKRKQYQRDFYNSFRRPDWE